MDLKTEALKLHAKHQGKLATLVTTPIKNISDITLAYTPGVAEASKVIARDKSKVYKYTIKGHTIAVVSDGSAVLGLGNIGPEAALPVMEGKAALFKTFANLDAFPGVFKGALQAKAKRITEKMKVKAAEALASLVKKPTVDKIIPSLFDKGVTETVAKAVAQAATVRK